MNGLAEREEAVKQIAWQKGNKVFCWLNVRRNAVLVLSGLTVIVIAFLLAFIGRTAVIHLNGDVLYRLPFGTEYAEPGYTAYMGRSEIDDVTVDGTVDCHALGDYCLIYTARYGKKTAKAVRTVRVFDDVAPLLNAPDTVDVAIGITLDNAELAYTATDNADGDLTGKVIRTAGENSILLSVTDVSGNKTEKTVTVNRVKDNVAPTVSLSGAKYLFLLPGGTYREPGYSAKDNIDGDLTDDVMVESNVDTSSCGTYRVTYRVTDSSDNCTEAVRTVTVQEAAIRDDSSREKVIYLTFDDGPCANTAEVLNILSSYGVKATFFVTNQKPAYRDMIAREADEGHTIGVHTYSHQYSIYASEETFFADIDQMNNLIAEQTGSPSRLMRFPGGSSNTVSRNYCHGIMSVLTKRVTERGYIYFDWNVSSGDASTAAMAKDPQWIANNVINNLKSGESVVLMHDVNSANLQSLPIILEYGLTHGYRFAVLDENSPTAHHGINN